MHPYSINSNERSIIQLLLAGTSIFLTWILKTNYNFPWWFEDPSIIGIYGVLYLIFDRYLWKVDVLRSMGLVQTPNINGEWTGHLKSSFDNFEKKAEATISIDQHWTSIEISFNTPTSKGKSVVAAIEMSGHDEAELTYTYLNEPFASTQSQMNIHKGTSSLSFSKKLMQADGDYYSGRGRRQYGEIHFKRILPQ